MQEKIYNYDNLKKEEIDEVVTRVKAIIINSSDEILLGYSHKTYQFPGGHLEKGETIKECLVRELKEELGMDIEDIPVTPFFKLSHYNKNYHDTGLNRQNDIYYVLINTDRNPRLDKNNLTDWEREGSFTVKRVPLSDVTKVLIDSIPDNPVNKVITEEMIEALKEYQKVKNKIK